MKDTKPGTNPVPWNSAALWKEANNSFGHIVRHFPYRIEKATFHARMIRDIITALSPVMDELCSICHSCASPCCTHATIWYDFRDLLYLHLTGASIPGCQIVKEPGMSCPLFEKTGCTIHRVFRPFICTWYICPGQNAFIHKRYPEKKQKIQNMLFLLKKHRKEMENKFIHGVCMDHDLARF